MACAAVALSFIFSLIVFWYLPASGIFKDYLFTWIESEPFKAEIAFQVDALTAVMLLVITGIGFLIHVYSIGYMGNDPGYYRYFAYLNLFMAMMLTLVLLLYAGHRLFDLTKILQPIG